MVRGLFPGRFGSASGVLGAQERLAASVREGLAEQVHSAQARPGPGGAGAAQATAEPGPQKSLALRPDGRHERK